MSDEKVLELVNQIESICGYKVALVGEEGEIIAGSLDKYGLGHALEGLVRSTDRHAFAAALIKGEIDEAESYKLASALGIVDSRRVVFVFELATPISDVEVIDLLSSVFASSEEDYFCKIDDTHLCAIWSIEDKVSEEEIQDFALQGIATIESEALVTTKCGYSSIKTTVGGLKEGFEEAKTSLLVMSLISDKEIVAGYDKLGMAGLIYELPKPACERFLRDVFGEKNPLEDMSDEELGTIDAFYDNDLNISETARELYLHRNTLVYRLEQISKKLGLDIRHFEDAMRLRTAMAVLSHYKRDF